MPLHPEPENPVPHEFVRSQVGHGETQCKWCLGTNRELAVISPNHCASRARHDPKWQRPNAETQAAMAEVRALGEAPSDGAIYSRLSFDSPEQQAAFIAATKAAFMDGYDWGNIDDFPSTKAQAEERWSTSECNPENKETSDG